MFHRQFYVRHTVWYKWKSCRTCQSFAWFVWQVLQLTTTYTVNAFNGTIFLIIQLLRLCSTGMEWSYLSRAMTKPTMWLCAQQRLRSAWASAQSDQSLRWAHTHFVGFVMSWLISICLLYPVFCCCFYWDFTARRNYLTSFVQVGRKWKILKKNNLPTRKQILACPSWAQTHSSEMTINSEC